MTSGRSILARLAALALVLNALGPTGMVLCIGDGGHLGFEATCVETPHEVDCCAPDHHDDEADTLAAADHCGDCTDLPLLTNPLLHRAGLHRLVVATGVTWLDTSFRSPAPHSTGLSAPSPRDRALGPPGWLRDARTIVLRL